MSSEIYFWKYLAYVFDKYSILYCIAFKTEVLTLYFLNIKWNILTALLYISSDLFMPFSAYLSIWSTYNFPIIDCAAWHSMLFPLLFDAGQTAETLAGLYIYCISGLVYSIFTINICQSIFSYITVLVLYCIFFIIIKYTIQYSITLLICF